MTTHTLTRFEHDLVSYLDCTDAHAVALADSLIELGITTFDEFEDALMYRNDEYTSRPQADFAQWLAEECECLVFSNDQGINWVVIDWQASWDANLRHDFTHISIDECDYFLCRY